MKLWRVQGNDYSFKTSSCKTSDMTRIATSARMQNKKKVKAQATELAELKKQNKSNFAHLVTYMETCLFTPDTTKKLKKAWKKV